MDEVRVERLKARLELLWGPATRQGEIKDIDEAKREENVVPRLYAALEPKSEPRSHKERVRMAFIEHEARVMLAERGLLPKPDIEEAVYLMARRLLREKLGIASPKPALTLIQGGRA